MLNFFDRMQILLKKRGMTAADISRIIGVSQPSINGWKNGSVPRADIACRVADTLGTSVEWLVTGQEEKIPKDVRDVAYEILALPFPLRQIVFDTVESCKRQLSTQEGGNISNAV